MNGSISANQEDRAAEQSAGMETNENAFDAFAVLEPIDDFGECTADHDNGGDGMERSEWSERDLGYAPAEGVY